MGGKGARDVLSLGQTVEVVANGSPFYGERGTLVGLLDAERCVVVALTHVARIGDANMAPVPLQVRLPLDQLQVFELVPATVAAQEPPAQEGANGEAEHHAPATDETGKPEGSTEAE